VSSSPPTTTALFPYVFPTPFPSCRFLCETWWLCHSNGWGYTWRQRSDSMLTTEQPWSVMTPFLRRTLDPVVRPEPGWQARVPDWQGIPCSIGRVEIWPAVPGGPPPRPFSLLVLLPRRDPPEELPYVYLGIQFLIEYNARLELDCSAGDPRSCTGQLIIP